ncbi:MAG: phytoene/squalene synthase family protein [Fidelibacterota bacterium]
MKGDPNKPHLLSHAYVKNITALYARSFYFASRFFPKHKRQATYALYGFARYTDNLVDNPRDRDREELQRELDHLRWEIETAYRRKESEHPALKPFIQTAISFSIPIEYPLDLIKGVSMDISHSRYTHFEDLYVYCYRVAGTIGLMMTYIIGFSHRDAFEYAEKLGVAMQLTNILRDIREDKNRGKIYIPMSELERYDVAEEDIFQERFSPAMRSMLKATADNAHRYYEESASGIRYLDTDSRFAIHAASRIYRGILEEFRANDYNPFKGRVSVSFNRKMAITLTEYMKYRRDKVFNRK